MKIGAVVVTYHTPAQTLQSCLASLKQNHVNDIEVVDNGRDAAVQSIAQHNAAGYQARPNRGFATAANTGAANLSTPYLLFLNPDAILPPQACYTAQTYLNTHPHIAVIGLLLSSPDGYPEQHSFGDTVTPLSLLTRKLSTRSLPTRPIKVGWVSGGALLIRHDVFLQLHGFDPQFFLYWEDVDLCRRVRQLGRDIVLLPQVKVMHRRGASLNNIQHKTKLYDESADRYFRKHYPIMIWQVTRWLRSRYRSYSPRVD